jgi:stage II sporulation protein R
MRNSHHFFSFSSVSRVVLLIVAIGFGLLGIAGQYVAASLGDVIPEDAIRIRIIANSDKKADQSAKNKVRDEIASYIQSWGGMPDTHDEAYALIKSRLNDIQGIVDRELNELGVSYEGVAELGEVPFPEKTFDGESYEAGNYEALRITLGKGKGTNWWCVLFPPLCLTAATADEDAGAASEVRTASAGDGDEAPKAKFFLWELLEKLFAFLGSLFG